MKTILAFAAAGLLASTTLAQTNLFAVLDGAQEVGPVPTPATGSASLTLSGGPGSWILTYELTFGGLLGTVTDGHIHNQAAGVNGPVVHFLDDRALGTTGATVTGDWRFDDDPRPLTDALAGELLAGRTYFNIHTTFRTSGEIRGQILVPEPATVGLALPAIAGLLARRRR